MKHTYLVQVIARILIVGLFLQGCQGFENMPLNGIEGQNKQSDTQAILDKEFVADGGHLVKFYKQNDELKATVQVNPLDEKDKLYNEVPVVIEEGVELKSLVHLNKKAQQNRILIQFSKGSKPTKVAIHKPWLMGGISEVIMFCGNPGVGKSSLCNAIFQQAVFRSGVSAVTGMTIAREEHTHGDKLYIDTPGLADVKTRQKAAVEIEEALKKNNNYKIVFVATLESGRVRPDDVTTIETVCETIKVPFEYGIIFNKVTKGIIEDINLKGLDYYLSAFKKKPYITVVLKRDDGIEDRPNVYFKHNSENRESLLYFLNNLRSAQIGEDNVKPLEVRNYKQRLNEIQARQRKEMDELNRKYREEEIMRRQKESTTKFHFYREEMRSPSDVSDYYRNGCTTTRHPGVACLLS
jgi:GTP-binding protein EngB required for normal cell division